MMAIITPRAIPVNFFGSGKTSNLLVFLSDAANYPQAHGSTVVALHPVVFTVLKFHRERRCFET